MQQLSFRSREPSYIVIITIVMFVLRLVAIVNVASAFVAPSVGPENARSSLSTTVLFQEKGAGGMFDTRNPDALEHEDPRKSISAAPSFEEYLKQRSP